MVTVADKAVRAVVLVLVAVDPVVVRLAVSVVVHQVVLAVVSVVRVAEDNSFCLRQRRKDFGGCVFAPLN